MGKPNGENPEELKEQAISERLERWFWSRVAMFMIGMALGVAISAIMLIFLMSLYIFLEVH